MPRHRKNSGIPDRWLDYKAVGKRLRGTRFVAFKVPLKESLTCELRRSDVFGHWELLDALRRDDQELGLIVDLTFTERYYNLQDVPESLLFLKIFTAGHEVPSDKTILSFKRVVRRFLRDNADNDKLIGVHCTHGLNRTGYLICRYLIDVDGMDPAAAVELFNSSRGHAIERQNYLDDLQRGPKRSNEGMDKAEQAPQRGCALRRPRHSSPRSDSSEERGAHDDDSWYHRSFPPRGIIHGSQYRHPHVALPPPPPSFRPAAGASHLPSRWTPPHPYGQWRRPPHPEESRSGYRPHEQEWRPPAHLLQEDRRRAAPPPLPRYRPRWTDESGGRDGPGDEWAGPEARHHHRHTRRENGYEHYQP